MITLENNQIKLRALEPNDIDILYNWENDQNLWQVSNTLVPFSKYILNKYIENSHQDIYQNKQLRLVIEKQTDLEFTPVGTIDLFDFDPFHQRAGIGIFVEKSHRQQGIAKSALDLIISYCFNTLGLHLIYCNISTVNKESIKLFKSAGFEIKGEKTDWNKIKDGWENEYFLQLINPS